MSDKASLLEQMRADILEAHVCPDLAEQATQLVMGDGNLDADIVFIGEAPGKKEDEMGVPFVGASGRFLNVMLDAASLERDDVYITNIVKYRPPNNRDPSPEEKIAFLPYLMRQLKIIQPKVIITLGRHSMECFLPKAKIAEQHGVPTEITHGDSSWLLVPLYHPAAALYNGSMRQTLIDDFLHAVELAKSHTR